MRYVDLFYTKVLWLRVRKEKEIKNVIFLIEDKDFLLHKVLQKCYCQVKIGLCLLKCKGMILILLLYKMCFCTRENLAVIKENFII